MKKLFLIGSCLAVLALSFTSCDDDESQDKKRLENLPYYAYVLNEGSWGKNDASITGFTDDVEQGLRSQIYYQQNGKNLGDVANDLIWGDNDCLYVVVSTSQYLAKLSLTGKELARYAFNDAESSPRSIVQYGSDVYVSTYGGMVERFDTASITLKGSVTVGTYPEDIALINNYLAVCNSGYGAENTLSIIDLNSFTVTKTVTLPHYNPQNIVVCDGKFYCNTTEYDQYWNAVSNIVEVDPTTWTAKDITEGFYMCPADNKLLIASCATNYYTTPYTYEVTLKSYDPAANTVGNSFLNLSGTTMLSDKGVYGISYDKATGDIYVLVSNQEGSEYVYSEIYVFDSTGAQKYSITSGGVLASKVVFDPKQ